MLGYRLISLLFALLCVIERCDGQKPSSASPVSADASKETPKEASPTPTAKKEVEDPAIKRIQTDMDTLYDKYKTMETEFKGLQVEYSSVKDWEKRFSELSKELSNELSTELSKEIAKERSNDAAGKSAEASTQTEKSNEALKKAVAEALSQVQSLQTDLLAIQKEIALNKEMALKNEEELKLAIERLKQMRQGSMGIDGMLSRTFDGAVYYSECIAKNGKAYLYEGGKSMKKMLIHVFFHHVQPHGSRFAVSTKDVLDKVYAEYGQVHVQNAVAYVDMHVKPYYAPYAPFIENTIELIQKKATTLAVTAVDQYFVQREVFHQWLDVTIPPHAFYAAKAIDILILLLLAAIVIKILLGIYRLICNFFAFIKNILHCIFIRPFSCFRSKKAIKKASTSNSVKKQVQQRKEKKNK